MQPRSILPFLLLAEAVLAADNPLPIPPNITPEIIAGDFRFNGSPMRIAQFRTFSPSEGGRVVEFYRRLFREKAKKGGYSDQMVGIGQNNATFGALIGKELINVELKREGKRTTLFLISSLQPDRLEKPEKLAKDMPKMQGTQVYQHQESRDGPKRNRMVFMFNPHSVESNAIYLREHYLRLGWTRLSDHTVKTTVRRQLMFGKGNRRLYVDMQRNPGENATLLIFNEMWESTS